MMYKLILLRKSQKQKTSLWKLRCCSKILYFQLSTNSRIWLRSLLINKRRKLWTSSKKFRRQLTTSIKISSHMHARSKMISLKTLLQSRKEEKPLTTMMNSMINSLFSEKRTTWFKCLSNLRISLKKRSMKKSPLLTRESTKRYKDFRRALKQTKRREIEASSKILLTLAKVIEVTLVPNSKPWERKKKKDEIYDLVFYFHSKCL